MTASPEVTVLLVEDDRHARDATRRLLEGAGARVLTASDGGRALEVLHVVRPDLVLTDLVMPGIDGIGLLRTIRSDARWASLLVVALTTSDEAAALARVGDAGFDGQLTKPVASTRLAAYVGAARAARR